jgi:hypothetical protein
MSHSHNYGEKRQYYNIMIICSNFEVLKYLDVCCSVVLEINLCDLIRLF